MAEVQMYGTAFCPYCVRARMLLDRKGVAYEDIRIDKRPEYRYIMEEKAGGATSVPQIFIDGRHIGGCDEMHQLDREGRLDPLLGLD
jgi:glutaredoxin 3